MPFFKWKDLEADLITPKYSPAHGPFVQGERILMGIFKYPAGGRPKPHKHPNEQIVSIIRGRGWMRIGDEEQMWVPETSLSFRRTRNMRVRITRSRRSSSARMSFRTGV